MKRRHWIHRTPRAAKWALVAILVPFLLVGCVSLEKARQIFDTVSQVCQLIDGIRQCAQIQTNIKQEVIMLQYGSGNPLPSNSPL